MMKTVSTLLSMLFAVVYAGVCAAEDISVLDDAVLDYSGHDSSALPTSQYTVGGQETQNVLNEAYYDYTRTQIDELEEADFAAFEDIPDALRVHD